MNKRIRELALQAGIDFLECTNPEHGGREYCEAWIEQQQKFAELIVRECVSLMNEEKERYDNPGTYESDEYYISMKAKAEAFDNASSIIKNHFGVEK